jgi:uncharacterized protein (TIGR01777 family)
MNVMIAGGSGLIGRALTKELLEHGHQVWILSRKPDLVNGLQDSVKVIGWDGKTTQGWGQVVNKVDVIVNLAGSPLNGNGPLDIWLTKKRRELLLKSRLDSTRALLNGVREASEKPSKFIQASAVGIYGPRGDELIDESNQPGTDFLADVQVQSERASEEASKLGMRRIVIRTGLVLDKDEGAFQYFKLQFSLFAGGRMGSGEQYYSWIHIQDEAAAIRFLLENENAEDVYNLTAPNPVRNYEFSKTLGDVMGRPSLFIIPGFLLRLVLGEISAVVLDGQRVLPKRLEELGYKFQYESIRDALADVVE